MTSSPSLITASSLPPTRGSSAICRAACRPFAQRGDRRRETEEFSIVISGENCAAIHNADRIRRTETDAKGEETEREIPFLKGYTVFNCEQIDGLPDHFYAKANPPISDLARIEKAEQFVAAVGADIRYGGNRAYYAIAPDHVQIPPFESFRDAESFYATVYHELTHWTRHPSRLNREFGRQRWGDAGYATEELVAELGAAFLCADLGITPEVREDHASYLASWLSVLKNDTRAVFSAAAHAQRAVDCLQEYGLRKSA